MADPDNKALVARILCSYLSNNNVAPVDLPSVIETVKKAFGDSDTFPLVTPSEATEKRPSAVPVKNSVAPDAITCLCCGQKFKSLKRHLHAEHQLSRAVTKSESNQSGSGAARTASMDVIPSISAMAVAASA